MKINANHHLEVGGVDVVLLAQKAKYPLYILDEQLLRMQMKAYQASLRQCYLNPGTIFYASKAFMALALCKIAEQEGLGLDVATEGELHTALKAHFPMERIILHGNNKSEEEIGLALQSGVGRIVIDNWDDIELLHANIRPYHKKPCVLVRVKPGTSTHTHHHIATAGHNSKFGFAIEHGEAEAALRAISENPNLQLTGLHTHIGSQILEMNDYKRAIDKVLSFMERLHHQRISIEELDVGGGLGVAPHSNPEKGIAIQDFVSTIAQWITHHCNIRHLPLPRLMMEPGRSIIAEAGMTLYKVGSIKRLPTGQTCVSVNGGMNDNIRPSLYQAKYHAILANKACAPPTERSKIVGKTCESGDVLIEEILLPPVERGDILAVFSTGAYTYSMASNYNRLPIPGVLLVKDGTADWIVKPQNVDDLLRNDLLPQRLMQPAY